MFQPLKQCLAGCRLDKNEEVEMASRERFQMQEPDVYSDRIFKIVPRWGGKCINVLGVYVEK
jgi:hypothetical protein